MHLLDNPGIEAGPLLMLQPGRGEGGVAGTADGVGGASTLIGGPRPIEAGRQPASGRLPGMDDIRTRVLVGGFANYYLDPQWRLTGNLLYGAGNERNGARLELGVQRLAAGIGDHHRVTLAAGIGIVNRHYSQTYFGVTALEASRGGFPAYAAGGGLQDAHAGVRWNWDWTPSWMLTTNVQAKRLLGSSRLSPLVGRPTNLTVSTAVAYRF
jgi:outer membrane scaffolding protein for murein synthesis (MipA/OmpV family)